MQLGENPRQEEPPKGNPGRADNSLGPAPGEILRAIPKSWLEAMSRKYSLDIRNPRRVRKTRKFDNSEYAELLTKMTRHGYLESDGDFILPEGNYV